MFVRLLVVALLAGPALAAPPNVVVILADDVGFGDLGCYGATRIRTPHLDRLAREGLRFTDAHSPAAVCTPTRYSLLTGQYAFRHPPASRILSGVAPLCVPADRLTVPQVFKRAGYATGVVGKWHLGLGDREPDFNAEITPGPKEVGFDRSFVVPATGDRVPCVYLRDGRVVNHDPADPIRVSFTQKVGADPTGRENPESLTNQRPSHGHDQTVVNGISRIGWMSGGTNARWRDEDMADTLTREAVGFVERHAARPFFLYFATHDAHVPRCPHPRFRGTSGHGLRGDAIQQLDWSVGRVLDALDRLQLAGNTLVLFTSDNGGVMDDGYVDGTADDQSGHRCNGRLRGFKGGPYEGGTRVPLLARWPGTAPAGRTSAELVCHVDLLATAAGLTGRPLPAAAGPDSFDLLPALRTAEPATPCRDHLVTQTGNPNWLCVRKGPWKLVPAAGKKAAGPELFHLGDDPGEATNLAARRPEVVAELAALLAKVKADGRSRPGGVR